MGSGRIDRLDSAAGVRLAGGAESLSFPILHLIAISLDLTDHRQPSPDPSVSSLCPFRMESIQASEKNRGIEKIVHFFFFFSFFADGSSP